MRLHFFFAQQNYLQLHPGCCIIPIICSFLVLSNIPWYGHPSFLNSPLIKEHLDCFQILAIKNKNFYTYF